MRNEIIQIEPVAPELSEAINLFLNELPDPRISNQSTFIHRFIVAEKEVVLNAQKCKGISGMQWAIHRVQ